MPGEGTGDRAETYRLLFEAAKEGIVLVEAPTGLVLEVNRKFVEMTGHARSALVGRPLWELEPLAATDAALVAVRELQQRDHIFYDDLPLVHKKGARTNIEMRCTALQVGTERIIECTFRDTSARRSLEDELWRSEARFRALFRNAHSGIAFIDMSGKIIDNNPALEELLGYEEGELHGRDFGSFALSEDRVAELLLFQDVAAGNRESYHLTVRHLRRDGTTLWGLVGVTAVRATGRGTPLIIRIVEDITDRKRAEEAVIQSRDFYRSLLNELPNPIRLADTTGRCDYFNRAWRAFTGRSLDREIGAGWTESIHADDRAEVLVLLESAIAKRLSFTAEYRLRNRDGEHRWIVEFGNPFNDVNGIFAGYVSSCYDVHERKILEETLKSISITDELTGLLNRRGFFALAQQQVKIANRAQRGLVLLFGDLDGLKEINDTYGHSTGDNALVETARLLRDVFRESDIIARLGGDEFAVLMTEDSGSTNAETVASRMREAVDARNRESTAPYDLRISVGIKCYDPARPTSLDRLVSDADGLMYDEKKRKKGP